MTTFYWSSHVPLKDTYSVTLTANLHNNYSCCDNRYLQHPTVPKLNIFRHRFDQQYRTSPYFQYSCSMFHFYRTIFTQSIKLHIHQRICTVSTLQQSDLMLLLTCKTQP